MSTSRKHLPPHGNEKTSWLRGARGGRSVYRSRLQNHRQTLLGAGTEAPTGATSVMRGSNRAPDTGIMGDADRRRRVDLMGGPDRGPRLELMGGPDRGPRLDLMGGPDRGRPAKSVAAR